MRSLYAAPTGMNAGPLLYHFADMPNEFSVEFTWEEIRKIAVDYIGFEIVVRDNDNDIMNVWKFG